MKLTMKEVQTRMSASWGRKAVVIPYRICGNRYRFAVTDHGEHWIPLDASWVGGCQVFEPSDGAWPEPKQTTWSDAVQAASHRAMAYFVDQGNSAALRRLPRAEVIADSKNWQQMGDEADTWLIRSSSKVGVVYQVNGRCTCSWTFASIC